MSFEDYRIHFGGEMSPEKAQAVVAQWVGATRAATGRDDIGLAAPFQRHYFKFGTGIPTNFCLALTPTEALVLKLNPRNAAHPMNVRPAQIGKQIAAWPRSRVQVSDVEAGRIAIGVRFDMAGTEVPCRTPRTAINPAAVVVIGALGGELPA